VAFLDREEGITKWLGGGKASIVVVIPPDFQLRMGWAWCGAHIQVMGKGDAFSSMLD